MYTAKYLNSALSTNSSKYASIIGPSYTIDIIEKLPTPFGLVRSGVAPDHPEVKNVENDFVALFEGETNAQDVGTSTTGNINDDHNDSARKETAIAFRGNVEVGRDVSLSELQSLYDVVVLAYGCESDRRLGVPGEDLVGVLSAREFVGWYNGHPGYVYLTDTLSRVLSKPSPASADVAVIGHGNVALDCARVLAKGSMGLLSTDIASHALSVLEDGVRKVTVVGRRGHIQGAFTIKELRELTKLRKEGIDVSFRVSSEEMDMGMTDASSEELKGPMARPKGRIDKLLRQVAAAGGDTGPDTDIASREVSLRFLMNPVEFLPSESDPEVVGALVCERTRLEGEAGRQRAVGTGQFETIPAQLALLSIGYKGVALPGLEETFDKQKGTIDNDHGRIINGTSENDLARSYCSGWIKRGPTGIIGTNIPDAKDTVSAILTDLEAGLLKSDRNSNGSATECRSCGREGLDAILKERSTHVVNWEAYRKIENVEKDPSRLRHEGQPREKITNVQDMLSSLQ